MQEIKIDEIIFWDKAEEIIYDIGIAIQEKPN